MLYDTHSHQGTHTHTYLSSHSIWPCAVWSNKEDVNAGRHPEENVTTGRSHAQWIYSFRVSTGREKGLWRTTQCSSYWGIYHRRYFIHCPSLRLMHIVYILYISHFQALNLNPSSHWFWRTCACVSFFSSSCPSFSLSSFSFSCCDGGQRKRRSCLNWRRWCPEAAAAAAGSYQQERGGGQEKRSWGLV